MVYGVGRIDWRLIAKMEAIEFGQFSFGNILLRHSTCWHYRESWLAPWLSTTSIDIRPLVRMDSAMVLRALDVDLYLSVMSLG